MPTGQSVTGFLGVEGVHVAHRVTGFEEDGLQLLYVRALGANVEYPIEGEAATNGHRRPAVEGKEFATGVNRVTVGDHQVTDLSVDRRVDGLEFVAAHLPADSDLICQGPNLNALGNGPVDSEIDKLIGRPWLEDRDNDCCP